jgi:peptide/nickel transport system ATP-binding protein
VILRPSHPYTQLLASAAPDPGLARAELTRARRARQAARAARAGGLAAAAGGPVLAAERRAAHTDAGCQFRPRCPQAMDVCATRPPDLPVGLDHGALCWLYRQAGPDGPTTEV